MAFGLESDHLAKQLAAAIGGDKDPLYKQLARLSGLPGTRPNLPFAERFGHVVASQGKSADAFIIELANLDAVIVLDAPKLAAHLDRIKDSLAATLGVAPERVNVKAKTSEGASPDFAAAHVVVLLAQSEPRA